ncbi:hypothetical protein PSH58_06245 [Pseudomonas hefeiensis]|nr:hypothetical protein [Pseudomonas sp. FP53]WLH98633.1 hypothetical protein PSH58_06245 [Pseudomonas sp. FP53]
MKTMDDSNGRRKRIFRRTNKVKRLPIRFHRRKKEPQRVIFLVHKPSEDLIEANRPKRSKHATEHTPIVIYIICSRDSAEVVSDRQDG